VLIGCPVFVDRYSAAGAGELYIMEKLAQEH